DSLVESIGIKASTAGKKIVKAIRKGKVRVVTDAVAGLMDFGMRVCPSFTCKATGSAMKKFSPKIASFKPIYAEQIENKQAIKQMKKERKKTVYKKLEQVPQGAFKDDDLTNI
ncbi:MAG: hypothetical protein K2O31_01300, partial [Clostridia bacterium]|nr:hypothetical protein [Clostridia bacterium]